MRQLGLWLDQENVLLQRPSSVLRGFRGEPSRITGDADTHWCGVSVSAMVRRREEGGSER
jgi:hypothetical protein